MFKYAKPEGEARWQLISSDPKDLQRAIDKYHARYETVLEVDRDVDAPSADESDSKYKGPMYFDLDSTDEEQSLHDVRRLLIKLYWEYGVNLNDIQIWASGGKGFHVTVPMGCFIQKPAFTSNLAKTYKNVAMAFDLETLDYGIYSQGKGRMWRIENLQRPNKRYKVRLDVHQVFSCSIQEIVTITQAPGKATVVQKEVTFAHRLAALYAASKWKERKAKTAVPDARIKDLKDNPSCITKILEMEDVNEDKTFNQIALTLATFFVGRGADESEFRDLVDKYATDGKSTKYRSKRDRMSHLISMYHYAVAHKDYRFECQYARNLVIDAACSSCPVNAAKVETEDMGIELINGCYYKRMMEGSAQLTTFEIMPMAEVDVIDGTQVEHFIKAKLVSQLGRQCEVVYKHGDWSTKAKFLNTLPSPHYAFLGGDQEVQRIFHQLMKLDIPKQKGVKAIGLHKYEQHWHFVTHDSCISMTGEQDVLILTEDMNLGSGLAAASAATTAELTKMIPALYNWNANHVVMPVLGWFAASFYKERIFEHNSKFPILFIFGEAGSGKTSSALALRRMFAVSDVEPLKAAGDVTGFTLARNASRSNTLPLIIDEYKPAMLSADKIKLHSAAIRTAYNNHEAERGRPDQTVNLYRYRAPMVYIGEQAITEKAVKNRIVEVQFVSRYSKPHEEDFMTLQQLPLEKLGRVLLEDALTISDEEMLGIMAEEDKKIPGIIRDRDRFNLQVTYFGIRMLHRALDKRGISHDLLQRLDEFRGWRSGQAEIYHHEDIKTDVDRIIEVMSLMVRCTDTRLVLTPKQHYVIDGDLIHLDLKTAYAMYMRYSSEYETDTQRMNMYSFCKQLRQEPYCVCDNAAVKFPGGVVTCWTLSIPKLKEKHVDVEAIVGFDSDIAEEKPLAFKG